MAIETTWDEDSPAGTESRALGDDRIREMKKQIRQVLEMDHNMSSTASATDSPPAGYHNKTTFIKQTSDPTEVTDTLILYSKDVDGKPELHSIDEDGNVVQLTIPLEIKMFGGLISAIPTGWSLCDGASGRPNLVGKFIRGVNTGATNPGATGGSDSITLAEANLPAHLHTIGGESAHTHTIALDQNVTAYVNTGSGPHTIRSAASSGFATGAGSSHTHTCGSIGSGTAFDNRPSYYELAFIIRSA